MFYLLDIILICNLIFSLKYFREISAPSNLLGFGMFGACVIATLFYNEWGLDDYSDLSVICIGLGTICYTSICVLLNRKHNTKSFENTYSFGNIKKSRCLFFMYISMIIAFISVFFKYRYITSKYGYAGGLGEMVFAYRIDAEGQNMMNELPGFVKKMSILTGLNTFFVFYFLSLSFFSKHLKSILYPGIINFIILLFDGFLSGAKGNIFYPIVTFFVIYMAVRNIYKGRYKLNLKKISIYIILIIAILGSFNTINTLIGRSTEENSNFDMVGEYWGAELKNFDIYIKGQSGNIASKGFLDYTLRSSDVQNRKISYNYLEYKNFTLGNVYTQYYEFHQDGGVLGVFILTIIEAIISMLFYSLYLTRRPGSRTWLWALFVYSACAYYIFMSFFSEYLLKFVFSIDFLKTDIIYLGIMCIFLPKILADKGSNNV